MKKVRLFVAALLLGAGFTLRSQEARPQVKGILRDGVSGDPDVGAVVQFLKAPDGPLASYAVSDSLGCFEQSLPAPGEYVLSYENLGRESFKRTFSISAGQVLDMGEIATAADPEQLKGAQTTAMRTLVRMDVDKMTYRVEDDADSKTSTVLDMLRKVPMVTVDGQDNITVNGSSSFKVYVDGKPNQMLSANPSPIFKVMPASSVKEIQVITNPGAKYDAEGTGGVLNLVTGAGAGEKLVQDGVYGTVGIGGTYNGRFGNNTGVFLNAQKGRWTFGADVNAGVQRNPTVTIDESQVLESAGMYSAQTRHHDGLNRSPMLFGNLSASFELDSLNLFSATVGLDGFNQKGVYNEQTFVSVGTSAASAAPVYSYASKDDGHGKSSGLNASVDWQRSWAAIKDRTLTFSYRYSSNPSSSYSGRTFSDITGVPAVALLERESDDNRHSVEHTLQGDFSTPLAPGHTLSAGLKYIMRHNSSDSRYLEGGTPVEITDYDWYNRIGALYAEYGGTFGAFSATAGLRYERTWQTVDYNAGAGTDFDKQYGNFVPAASVQWNMGPMSNLGLSYNMRISRPGIWYLNPYVNRADPSAISYGNTALDAERGHTINLVFNTFSPKFMLNLTARHSFGNDGISAYSFIDGDGIYNTTYDNIVRKQNTGLNAFFNWSASKTTRIFANTSLSYVDLRAPVIQASSYGWEASLNGGLQQSLPHDWMISNYWMVSSDTHSLQGINSGFNAVVLSISKKMFDERLNISLSGFAGLPSGKLQFDTHTIGPGFIHDQSITLPMRQLSFYIG